MRIGPKPHGFVSLLAIFGDGDGDGDGGWRRDRGDLTLWLT